jgi:hypothetical protein
VWEWVFVREIDIGADYSFLIQGYKPAYLFWETLDMVRKVLMVGVVVLVGRGSVMQLVMGATVTVFLSNEDGEKLSLMGDRWSAQLILSF